MARNGENLTSTSVFRVEEAHRTLPVYGAVHSESPVPIDLATRCRGLVRRSKRNLRRTPVRLRHAMSTDVQPLRDGLDLRPRGPCRSMSESCS